MRVLVCRDRPGTLVASPDLVRCRAVSQQGLALQAVQFRQPQSLPAGGMDREALVDRVECVAWAVEQQQNLSLERDSADGMHPIGKPFGVSATSSQLLKSSVGIATLGPRPPGDHVSSPENHRDREAGGADRRPLGPPRRARPVVVDRRLPRGVQERRRRTGEVVLVGQRKTFVASSLRRCRVAVHREREPMHGEHSRVAGPKRTARRGPRAMPTEPSHTRLRTGRPPQRSDLGAARSCRKESRRSIVRHGRHPRPLPIGRRRNLRLWRYHPV